jgi:uncharacterized SAM-binding protein YcdF (DUF218 family)
VNEIGTYSFVVAALWLMFFLVSFARDRRRLRNGIYLLMTPVFVGIGLLFTLASVSRNAAGAVVLGFVVLIPLLILALSVFLISNGVIMIRREGRRPGNLLSMVAGLGLIAVIVFDAVAFNVRWLPLRVFRSTITDLLGYVAFLFTCYLLYSIVYGRVKPRRAVDFVIVLGAGLLGRTRVSPLLASRLNRGRAAYHAAIRKGRDTMLITSGGQGPAEQLSEARAMADYLVEKGIPAERILLEEQSTTTEENLTFSRNIMRERLPNYRCVVVTSNYHAMRAALLARKVKLRGHVIGSPTAMYFWPSATIREFVAIFLDHWIINGSVCLLIVLAEVLSAVR